jgi:uncharacterized protein (TIGR00251 family)
MSLSALHVHPDGVLVDVWVVPGASRDEVGGFYDGALRVRVTAPPEGGKANRAVGRVIAAALGVRRVTVHAGATSRRKRVLIPGTTVEQVAERLSRRG